MKKTIILIFFTFKLSAQNIHTRYFCEYYQLNAMIYLPLDTTATNNFIYSFPYWTKKDTDFQKKVADYLFLLQENKNLITEKISNRFIKQNEYDDSIKNQLLNPTIDTAYFEIILLDNNTFLLADTKNTDSLLTGTWKHQNGFIKFSLSRKFEPYQKYKNVLLCWNKFNISALPKQQKLSSLLEESGFLENLITPKNTLSNQFSIWASLENVPLCAEHFELVRTQYQTDKKINNFSSKRYNKPNKCRYIIRFE